EPATEIRIRFDRPMDRSSALIAWDYPAKAGFRPRGEMSYRKATREFVFPVYLLPGQKHGLTMNREAAGKAHDYEGFQCESQVPPKLFRWSFTTKRPAKDGGPPRVTSLVPSPDTEVSLVARIEVTFDQPMAPDCYDLTVPEASAFDRRPQILGAPE